MNSKNAFYIYKKSTRGNPNLFKEEKKNLTKQLTKSQANFRSIYQTPNYEIKLGQNNMKTPIECTINMKVSF